MAKILLKRGTRAQIDAAAAASQLSAGEPYLITDENRLSVAIAANAHSPAARHDHVHGNSGTATLDFGAFPGSNEASVAVTGQTGILATSTALASLMAEDSADHSAGDHAYAAGFIGLSCSVPTAGTGFTINARSQDKMQGTFKVRWSWK